MGNRTRLVLLMIATLLMTGCGSIFGACESIQRANLNVEVRGETGQPAAQGATGIARHSSGITTELSAFDSLRLNGLWDRERAGKFTVEVRKPGYVTVTGRADVDEDRCHVRTATVPVTLVPNASAVPQAPLRLVFGTHIRASEATAGIRVKADTLEITGSAFAPCSQLRAVAVRDRDIWHIQLEPERWEPLCTSLSSAQPFEVRYRLAPGVNYLLITAGWGQKAELFSGWVHPQ